jgi:hypothetical protein
MLIIFILQTLCFFCAEVAQAFHTGIYNEGEGVTAPADAGA